MFPLRENTREPLIADDWRSMATTDASTIRQWWTAPVTGEEYSYNVGCMTNDFVVIDVDVKKGKDGYNEYMQMGGNFDTLVVRTTTGGFHCYFYGPESNNSPLSNGVDVRSHNGYVVAPGSIIDNRPYEVISDRDLAWIPDAIERRLTPPYARTAVVNDADIEQDTPASVQAGIRFLESAPLAIQGLGGDNCTFQTAARLVREMALSISTAYTLMRDYWNERCSPPWETDELWQKVQNAAQYGTADEGALTAANLFGHFDVVAPPTIFDQGFTDFGNATLPIDIKPRPWLVEKMLMLGAVTLLLASGSAGKSTLALALAVHLAMGKDFAGFTTRFGCKVIVYNGEDDRDEQSRRLLAVCMAYGFDYSKVKEKLLILSQRDLKLTLVAKEFNRALRNDELIKQITDKATAHDVGLLIVDPLVKIHAVDESDNVQMDVVMETLTDIAYKANVAVLALHHTTKSTDKQENRVGNMDIGRGASAVVNAARIAFTLLTASQQDCEEYGFSDDQRHSWARLDDAKMNMSLASNKAVWFHKEGLKIPSNDVVGVLKHEPIEKSQHHIRGRFADLLLSTMQGNGAGSMSMQQAVSVIKGQEPLMANKTDAELRRRIESLFAQPVQHGGHTIQCCRDKEDPSRPVITMF